MTAPIFRLLTAAMLGSGVFGCTASAEGISDAARPPSPHASRRAGDDPAAQPVLEEWKVNATPRAWKYIVLHHSATTSGSVESIDRAHRRNRDAAGNPWRGIGYHFVIGNGDGMPDGAIESTFRWRQQIDGAHAGVAAYNEFGLGVCLIGNFERQAPTAAQLRAVKRLAAALQTEFEIDPERVLAHRDVKSTACPGRLFPVDDIARATPQTKPASPTSP